MSEQNVNDLALLEEQFEYDPDAELNPTIMVPDGWHTAQLKLGKNGITVKTSGSGRVYLKAHIAASIIAPGERFDKRVVGDFPTSIVFESSQTSMLHVLAREAGATVPSRGTLGQLKAALESVLGGEGAQLQIRTRWEANINLGTKQEPQYETVAKGMKSFPTDAEGNFIPRVTFTDPNNGNTTEVDARESIKDFRSAARAANGNGAR